jgi:hypothetical protein
VRVLVISFRKRVPRGKSSVQSPAVAAHTKGMSFWRSITVLNSPQRGFLSDPY